MVDVSLSRSGSATSRFPTELVVLGGELGIHPQNLRHWHSPCLSSNSISLSWRPLASKAIFLEGLVYWSLRSGTQRHPKLKATLARFSTRNEVEVPLRPPLHPELF
ncbi:hypothetical protein TcWFU_001364 [Taenia crassiceps]|uniref:Uncharacterized protein n=1 Tax=Taenia crassiceps TaxID=6207 RepID=A0ABR4QAE0_9CEST